MRVNIVTGAGVKHKYTVDNFDSAVDIIKDYAKEHDLECKGPDEPFAQIHEYESNLLGIAHFFKHTSGVKHFEGSAFIWSI